MDIVKYILKLYEVIVGNNLIKNFFYILIKKFCYSFLVNLIYIIELNCKNKILILFIIYIFYLLFLFCFVIFIYIYINKYIKGLFYKISLWNKFFFF